MIPNLFILNGNGEILIEKHWAGHQQRQVCQLFWEEVSKAQDHRQVQPIITTPRFYLVHCFRAGLFFLTVLQKETLPLLVIDMHHKIFDVFAEYAKNKLDEKFIRDQFALIYQLLDEMIDGGFPSVTELNQLKEMIAPPSLAGAARRAVTGKTDQVKNTLALGTLSKIPWRRAHVKHMTNEIYFDLCEELDVIMTSSGKVLKSQITGKVHCNCKLSAMPDLSLSFTPSSLLQDVSLHKCVRINRFQREKTVSFVPPDGHFDLLTYRISGSQTLPLHVTPKINYHGAQVQKGQGQVRISVSPNLVGTAQNKTVEDCFVDIPLPKETTSISLNATVGQVKFNQITKVCRWVIGKIEPFTAGSKTSSKPRPVLEGTIALPQTFHSDSKPTLQVGFTIKTLSSSGLKVHNLSVHNIKYKPFKGIRSITKAGNYQVRC